MNLAQALLDENFRIELERFLSFFNSNIDWTLEINEWLRRKRTEEQILERIRTSLWIDKDLEREDERPQIYYEVTKALDRFLDAKISGPIYILTCNENTLTAKGESLLDEYSAAIDDLITFRLQKKCFHSQLKGIPNDAVIIDLAWFFISDMELKELVKKKDLIHIPLFNINEIKVENIHFLRQIFNYLE